MKTHLRNAAFSAMEYVAYPATMLVVAPVTLRHLGVAQFGLWMICGAVISTGGMIASGFGDANLHTVARASAAKDNDAIRTSIRNLMTVNLLLGAAIAVLGFAIAGVAARHITAALPSLKELAALSLRLASLAILARAINSVAVSTQRALESFHTAATVHSVCHVGSLIVAAELAVHGMDVLSVVISMVGFTALSAIVQCVVVAHKLERSVLYPSFNLTALSALFRTGGFLWIQTLGSVLLDRADRIIIGLTVGAAAVAPYALCAQLVQPLAGLTGALLSFLFPFFTRRAVTSSSTGLRKIFQRSFAVNLALVFIPAAGLLLFGKPFLAKWAGVGMASLAAPLIFPLVCGAALTGLSVTGIYAVQALGEFKQLATVSLVSRVLVLGVLVLFVRSWGVVGLAVARAVAGASLLIVYPLLHRLLKRNQLSSEKSIAGVLAVSSGASL